MRRRFVTLDVFTQARFAGNPLTSDPARYARNAAMVAHDPTLGISGPTVAWLDAAFDAIAAFQTADYPSHIDQLTLMLAAEADSLPASTRRVPSSSCRPRIRPLSLSAMAALPLNAWPGDLPMAASSPIPASAC